MSSDPVGGSILFPSQLSRADLIAATRSAMELGSDEFQVRLPEDGFPRSSSEGYPFRTVEASEQALTLLIQEECGVIEGKGSKSSETYWFEPAVASYPVVTIWVAERAMHYDQRSEEIENFVVRWLQLCEQGHATFAYFSPFDSLFERDYLEDQVWSAFQSSNVRHFLEQITPSWLIYLGSELTEHWRQEKSPLPEPLRISQDLPSGTHFFRASLGVFESSLSMFHPW